MPARLKICLLSADNFVDDSRTYTSVLRRGTRYCEELRQFVWSQKLEQEEAKEVTRCQTTNREYSRLLNSLEKGIKFTLEEPKDFKDLLLPRLDFAVKADCLGNRFTHRYYEKSMDRFCPMS